MIRPLTPLFWGMLCGILLESQWDTIGRISELIEPFPFILIGGYGLILCLWVVFHRLHYNRLATYLLLVLVVIVGMTRYAFHVRLPVHHIANFVTDERVTLEGILYKPPEKGGDIVYQNATPNQYLYVKTTWLEQGASRYRACGNVRITLLGSPLLLSERKTFSYGDTIRTRIRLRLPQNFDDFDYQEYLQRQGIYLLGTLGHDRYIIKLPQKQGNVILTGIYSLRTRILDFLEDYVTIQGQSVSAPVQVIKAITVGTSRELSQEMKERFRNSGMYHFLVVSGIHVGILAGVGHFLLRAFRFPLRYGSLFLFPGLLWYAGVTGFHFPVLRAVIMAGVIYFAITCNRIPDPLYSLMFAGGVLIFLTPSAVFDVSFQMTVAATASILLLYKRLMRESLGQRLLQTHLAIRVPVFSLIMTTGAMLGIAPLLLFYFHEISPYPFISNLIALPIVSLILPLSLVTEVLSFVLPWRFLYPLVSVDVILVKGLLFLTDIFPPVEMDIPRFSAWFLLVYYLFVYWGVTRFRRHQ